MNKKYKDYYKTHIAYLNNNQNNYLFKYYQKNILPILVVYDKSIKILDIGCGKGNFAKFLKKEGFSNYIGLDLDEKQIEINKKTIDGYNFLYNDGLSFLETNKEKFDIIFISHVIEHITKEKIDILLEKIFLNLKLNSVFINIMPNGSSLFFSNVGRYADDTHEVLYTENSFTQKLLKAGFSYEKIKHKNTKHHSFFLNLLRMFVKSIIKFFVMFLGYPYPKVDTFEILTFAKK